MFRNLQNIFFIILLVLSINESGFSIDVRYIGVIDQELTAPTSMTVNQKSLTVLEPYLKQIKLFTPDGIFQYKVDIQGETNGLTSLSDDEYLFCDLSSKKVMYVSMSTGEQYDFFENSNVFLNPVDLINEDYLYVLDADTKTIYQVDNNKIVLNSFSIEDATGNSITTPHCFARNPLTGEFYILDQVKSEVWVLNSSGEYLNKFGSYGAGEGQITRAGDIAADSQGNIFISDRFQNMISIFNDDGIFNGYLNNLDSNVQINLNIPIGLALDDNGLLYISSMENSKIFYFYISTSSTNTEVIRAEQQFPQDKDSLNVQDLTFTASTTTSGEYQPVTGFDFEVYLQDNPTDPILNKTNGITDIKIDTLNSGLLYTTTWRPENIDENKDYLWRTRVHTDSSVSDWSDFWMFSVLSLPYKYELEQNYPNPFNPTTAIGFSIANESHVNLEIFNVVGQKVITLVDNTLPAGKHVFYWSGKEENGRQTSSGIYFYRLTAGTFVDTKKMILIK